jgi:hypothetical protein
MPDPDPLRSFPTADPATRRGSCDQGHEAPPPAVKSLDRAALRDALNLSGWKGVSLPALPRGIDLPAARRTKGLGFKSEHVHRLTYSPVKN